MLKILIVIIKSWWFILIATAFTDTSKVLESLQSTIGPDALHNYLQLK